LPYVGAALARRVIGTSAQFLNVNRVEAEHVNDISDSGVINALRRQMTVSVAKQVAAAGNLANVDTPGYKTKDATATFGDTLTAKLKPAAASGGDAVINMAEADGLETRRDGNNVQLDRELLNMSRAAGDFAAAQTALAAKFRLVRYAINEGR
jgi:flagellar basal-body rod protein FlgB